MVSNLFSVVKNELGAVKPSASAKYYFVGSATPDIVSDSGR
jgi:hypothetical protein